MDTSKDFVLNVLNDAGVVVARYKGGDIVSPDLEIRLYYLPALAQ